MMKILQIEWFKIRSMNSFKLLLGGFFLGLLGVYFLIATFLPGPFTYVLQSIYSYPEAWYFIHFVAYFFSFFPAIFMIIITTNEFQFGTCRQNIIDGWSRTDFVLGKVMLSFVLVLMLFAMLVLITLAGSLLLAKGFDGSSFFNRLDLPLATAIQLWLLLAMGFFLGVLIRKTGLASLIFFLAIPGEAILRGLLGRMDANHLNSFFPFKAHTNLLAIEWGDLMDGNFSIRAGNDEMLIGLVWIGVFCLLGFWLVWRRDLR